MSLSVCLSVLSGVMRTSRSWLRRLARCSAAPCPPSCRPQVRPGNCPRAWPGSDPKRGSCSPWAWATHPSTSGTASPSSGKTVLMEAAAAVFTLFSVFCFDAALWVLSHAAAWACLNTGGGMFVFAGMQPIASILWRVREPTWASGMWLASRSSWARRPLTGRTWVSENSKQTAAPRP